MKPTEAIFEAAKDAVEHHRGVKVRSVEHVGSKLVRYGSGWMVPPPMLLRVEWPGGWQFVEVI